MKRFSNSIKFVCCTMISAVLASVPSFSRAADSPKNPRIVACDAPVQSYKRGLCENHMSAEDFAAIAPGVSWFYNWDYQTKDVPAANLHLEFIPMCWGDTQDRLDGLDKYLTTNKPRVVLAINEPNLKGQAFIPPEQTAKLYIKIKAIADKYKLTTVGPQMALGSSNNDSIVADDPIEKKKMTYTFMVPFLKAFMYYVKPTEVGPISVHGYGEINELTWMSGLVQKEFNKPVWVTEYAWWNAPNDAAELKYLVQSTDLLERTPTVQGYAWFKERVGKNHKISLFEKDSGKLTKLGQAYVDMPVHDADLYYKLPGKLASAKYVQMNDMKINPTDDADAFLDMTADKAGASCDYNVSTDAAGAYTLNLRVKKPGEVTILKGNQSLATAKVDGNDWQTVTTKVQFAKGTQTIRVECSQKGQVVEWMEFVKP